MLESLLLLVASADPFAPARNDIPTYCAAEEADRPRAECIAEQKHALGKFVQSMVLTDRQTAGRCMREGKGARYVNWVKARSCMVTAIKRR